MKMHNAEYIMKTSLITSLLFILAIAAAALVLSVDNASAELTATANHDHVQIDFLYHGSAVSIRGISDPGTDLVVKVTAPEGHQALKKQGKVAGLLWMNVGELKFDHSPNLYFVHSTKKLEDILSKEEMDKYALGYPSLEKQMEISPVSNDGEKDRWFGQFVRYKEAQKLYATTSGKITTTMNNGKQEYFILTDWPYQAPPENYLVTVYAVKDKKVVEQAETRVSVEQAGIVKTLSGMAKNNGALYGILSILAALGAGFGVGLVFRKGGGAH